MLASACVHRERQREETQNKKKRIRIREPYSRGSSGRKRFVNQHSGEKNKLKEELRISCESATKQHVTRLSLLRLIIALSQFSVRFADFSTGKNPN